MKLEDQVCTLEQAKRLKELGVLQEAVWFWVFPAKERMISSNKGLHYHDLAKEIVEGNEGTEFDHDNCAAFTVAELGVMLPVYISVDSDEYEYRLNLWNNPFGVNNEKRDWRICYESAFGGKRIPFQEGFSFQNEAETRAAMLIHLLENNLTTPEEVNNRLNP